MKILLIHYRFGGAIGGVEFVMEKHAALLADAGHEVQVLCGSGQGTDPRVPVVVLRELKDHHPLAERRAMVQKLSGPVGGAHMVIVHNVMTMPFNPALTAALRELAARETGIRFIAWIHDLAADDFDGALREMLATAAPRFEYVAVSEHRRQQFEALTGKTARVVPNGIDPAGFLNLTKPVEALVRERSLLEKDLLLLAPARCLRRKNLELVLHTVAALKGSGLDVCAILTAAPDLYRAEATDYAASLRTLARSLGIEREIVFPNFTVTKRNLVALYSAVDALFYPSRQEGFGIPLLEAALHRLPVFCSDIPTMKELAPAEATLFPPEVDPIALAATMAEQIAGDPLRRARKRAIREFSWNSIYTHHFVPLLTDPRPPSL